MISKIFYLITSKIKHLYAAYKNRVNFYLTEKMIKSEVKTFFLDTEKFELTFCSLYFDFSSKFAALIQSARAFLIHIAKVFALSA